MHVHLPRARRARLLGSIALALAAGAVLVGTPGGPPPGDAVDRYRAGEPATSRLAVPADAAAGVRLHALAHARALGVPTGAAARLARVVDRFSGTVQDEVVTVDARGRRLGIVRLDGAGRVALAVRLGWQPPDGPRIDEAGARDRASGLAAAVGLAAAGTPEVTSAPDGGWQVTWQRTVDGVPALGDGSSITLFADGIFHAAAHRERSLAPAPAGLIPSGDVEQMARERLVDLLGPAASQARTARTRLAWVAPNDTFDATRPDAPDPVLRLAWVVQVRTVAPLADSLRALELYLDAGDGALLGGDLLR